MDDPVTLYICPPAGKLLVGDGLFHGQHGSHAGIASGTRLFPLRPGPLQEPGANLLPEFFSPGRVIAVRSIAYRFGKGVLEFRRAVPFDGTRQSVVVQAVGGFLELNPGAGISTRAPATYNKGFAG